MRKLHVLAIIPVIIIPMLILAGCGDTEEMSYPESRTGDEYYEPKIQNLIFYGTWEIQLEMTPNVSQPSFAWHTTALKYVVITIFRDRIDIKDNRIANPEYAIWTWNTSMGRGREGNVTYSDGRNVSNTEIQATVTPLSPGTYFIAAWAYDEDYELFYSSKEYKYTYNP